MSYQPVELLIFICLTLSDFKLVDLFVADKVVNVGIHLVFSVKHVFIVSETNVWLEEFFHIYVFFRGGYFQWIRL